MPAVTTVDRYEQLLKYLRDGWEIEPPVFVRPIWYRRADAKDAYHFVLKRGERRWLVTVPVSPATEQFIRDNDLSTNAL